MQRMQCSLIFIAALSACAESPTGVAELVPSSVTDDTGSRSANGQTQEVRSQSDAGTSSTNDASVTADAALPPASGDALGRPAETGRDAGTTQATSDAGGATSDETLHDAGSAGGAGGGASSGVWRPFSDTSPWNTLIPQNPALAPDSDALIADLKSSSQWGSHLDVNIKKFSIPVYYATSSTPKTDVVCELGGLGFSGNNGANAHAMIPIPQGATPDPESDHHIAIVDREHNLEWGMWNAANNGGKWTCGLGATADLAGDGLRPYKPTNPTWYTSHGARACGFPLMAGLIRTEEIDAGRIDHALVIAYPHIRAGFYMSPASTAQVHIGEDAISSRGIPCGGHIQLDPELDLDSLGLSRAGRIIAEALQRYGAFVGDYSGAINLYAENEASAQAHWQGILDTYELEGKIDLSDFRVLEFGELTDDGNGG